jgi:hypothetical protein
MAAGPRCGIVVGVSGPYLRAARLRQPDPTSPALGRVAEALGVPLVTDAGDLRVRGSDVHVRAAEVGRANALPTRMFGFDVDVVLAFTDIGRSSPRRRARVYTDVVRATLAATDVVGAHGVLFEDFDDDSLILRVDGGRLTLNDRWPGWRAWPEVLDVIPAPHRFAPLHMPR